MAIADHVETLGKITFLLLWCTALLGLNGWKLHWVRLRPAWHYGFAIATLAAAALHAASVMLSN